MFSILHKPQDSVNAEDLETLQNEIERHLVGVVTQKWDLEKELFTFGSSSPELASPPSKPTTKIEPSENSSGDFKSLLFDPNSNGVKGGSSGSNSGEDSVSSEESLVSSLTSSTIIVGNPLEPGSQAASLAGSLSGTKRSHKNNDRPSKRFRPNSSNSFSTATLFNKRPHHSKHRSKIVPSKFRNSQEESRPYNKKQISRNEAPDKLWPFVEQFCAAPTEEQIKELEEMIKAIDNNNDKEYFRVPSLGRKELNQKDSPVKSEGGKTPKKSNKSRNGEEEPGLGALTQRLVSSFIEESHDIDLDASKSRPDTPQPGTKKKNSKSRGGKNIDLNSAKNLEKRIRQELEEYDILDRKDDIPYTSEEDEVLRELVGSQHELFTIQCQNKELMQRLLKRAKKHLELQAERKKLYEANEDVIACYQRLIQAKQRKRNPTKKEKDAAWRALKIQEAIFRKCDDLYLSSLNRSVV